MRKGVCQDYCEIMKKMLRYVGVKSKVVGGWSKGGDSRPSEKLDRRGDHAWIIVTFWGRKWCMEPTWGSGVFGPGGSGFKKEYNEFCWCTPPEHFIWKHLPDRQRNTLLNDRKISLEEFEKLPFVHASFFEYGLGFVNEATCVLKPDKHGVASVMVLCRRGVRLGGDYSMTNDTPKAEADPLPIPDSIRKARAGIRVRPTFKNSSRRAGSSSDSEEDAEEDGPPAADHPWEFCFVERQDARTVKLSFRALPKPYVATVFANGIQACGFKILASKKSHPLPTSFQSWDTISSEYALRLISPALHEPLSAGKTVFEVLVGRLRVKELHVIFDGGGDQPNWTQMKKTKKGSYRCEVDLPKRDDYTEVGLYLHKKGDKERSAGAMLEWAYK